MPLQCKALLMLDGMRMSIGSKFLGTKYGTGAIWREMLVMHAASEHPLVGVLCVLSSCPVYNLRPDDVDYAASSSFMQLLH